MNAFWHRCKTSFWHLFYPAKCLHCQEVISSEDSILCWECAAQLELIDPAEKCRSCFQEHKPRTSEFCQNCLLHPTLFYQLGAAFDYIGPAATLIKKFKYANQPYLARGLGAFLAMQFDRLKWPLPDAVVPVPISFCRWMERGYNQSLLLANEFSKLLEIPVYDVLKRRSGDYSQAGLTLQQRRALKERSFSLRNKPIIANKTLLVIDDVFTSGTTLNKCAESLMEGSPSCLYALTVCRAT